MELLWPGIQVLCFLVLTDRSKTSPISEEQWPRPEDIELAERYLRKFFHLSHSSGPRNRRATLSSALEEKIRDMQDFFSLKQTGTLDLQTLSVMRKDRCGVPDVDNYSFYPDQPKWRNHTITYRIANYTPDLTKEEVETSLHLALKIWSDMAPLKFIKVNHIKADIVFSFARKTHEDFFPFDGPNGVLAHAFKPGEGMGGDVHFDEDEIWTMGQSKPGCNLFTVAAHEIGHSLGLSHSKDPLSLMYPDYKYYNSSKYTLPQDDMLGIQALYGKPVQKQYPLTISNKCDPKSSVDAVTLIGKEIVIFKSRVPNVVTLFHRVPNAVTMYCISGRKCWVVQMLKMTCHFGSIYEYGFPAKVRKIDAAVHISEYGKTFFFTGQLYYRFDEYRRRMDPGFPRIIQEDWQGIGKTVDAAFQLQGTLHLFSEAQAYHFDYRQNLVLNTIPANAWLGC
uniref:Peptidase metallopeptidase domain-containing protein n=1 Tax=Esox lucius TaxID=8010 RepID=A0A3P8YM85_ESOLU